MNHSLDRDTRKALVHLAERESHEYHVAARIVLALSAGQNPEQISRSIHRPVREVQSWIERFEAEGLDLFGDALQISPPTLPQPSPTPIESPQIDVEADSAPPVRTENREERRPRNTRQHRPRTSNPIGERNRTEPHREGRENRETTRPPRRGPQREPRRRVENRPPEPPIPSVDDAVVEGLEFLLQEQPDDPVITPPRKVIIPAENKRPIGIEAQIEATSAEILPPDPTEPISVSALAAAFEVDMAHARHISNLSRELFDITASIHRLPHHYRDLLHAAALLHNITFATDPAGHHLSGRDLILQYELKDISDEERQIIAIMTALHRSAPRLPQELLKMPKNIQAHVETLAALLRMGVGLDFSHTQTSYLQSWRLNPGTFILEVGGREATTDVGRAEQKSDLWNRLYKDEQIRFVTGLKTPTIEAPDLWPTLDPLASAVEVSNALRAHYARRLEYVAGRFRAGESGMLTPLWIDLQRLIGIWDWLIQGTRPSKVEMADTEWITTSIKEALYGAALYDRSTNLLDETDPDHDDPEAIAQLTAICQKYEQQASQSARRLQEALRSPRYYQWLGAAQTKLVYQKEDPAPYSGLIATRVWAYLAAARQIIDRVSRAGWNANLEILLSTDTVQAFELVLRRLADSLIFTGSLLGSELEQVLDVVDPLLDYVHAWQRMEHAAISTAQDWMQAKDDPAQAGTLQVLAMEALATMLRERADAMRWNLPEIWGSLDSSVFRRTLALAVAKP
jgi:hypothetical protein